MKTTTLRLYGKRDLHLGTSDLPETQEDEILATVVTNSLRLSSWKKANLGENHKKIPDDMATNPVIIGHEFYGDILTVGKKWQHKFQPDQRYVIQANLQFPGHPDCPGCSFPWVGGGTTHMVIPNEVVEQDCLLAYDSETYFEGSLAELFSCTISTSNANYHLQEGSYNHTMGIRPRGRTLILGGTGPIGLLAIDYALHKPVNPSLLVITDAGNDKLSYARKHYPSEPQTLIYYLNTADTAFDTLMALGDDRGFDDIFVFIPNEGLVTLTSSLLTTDSYLDLFAGLQGKHFDVPIGFYDMHCAFTHYVGTSGSNINDMRATIKLIEEREVQTTKVVTRILGLDAAGETTLELPAVGGGKKLICAGKFLPLTSLTQIQDQALTAIPACHQGIWSGEVGQYLLAHAEAISHD